MPLLNMVSTRCFCFSKVAIGVVHEDGITIGLRLLRDRGSVDLPPRLQLLYRERPIRTPSPPELAPSPAQQAAREAMTAEAAKVPAASRPASAGCSEDAHLDSTSL